MTELIATTKQLIAATMKTADMKTSELAGGGDEIVESAPQVEVPGIMEGGEFSKSVARRIDDVRTKARNMQIAVSKANGLSAYQIAEAFGISVSTVWQILGRENIRKMIEVVREDFYRESLPQAAVNMIEALKKGGGKKSDQKFMASERVLEGAGVLNSKTPSVYVEQIFNDNRVILSPLMKDMIEKHLSAMDDVVDASLIDEKDEKREKSVRRA